MRILLVEDELAFARAVRRGLEAEGFVVELAADGREGLRMANERPYDAVVLDIMLPGMNGYRVCAAMREAGTWTPVLMLTAKDGELDEAEALDTGADDFLSKPFSFVVLVARLRALLRRGGRERPAVLAAGDLRLDPAGHHAWRGSAEIDLTAREFALLELLIRRRGEVLTRREILDEVWDFGFDSDSNIVEVYVGYLRRKVDLPFGRRAIETVRGVGYRLAASQRRAVPAGERARGHATGILDGERGRPADRHRGADRAHARQCAVRPARARPAGGDDDLAAEHQVVAAGGGDPRGDRRDRPPPPPRPAAGGQAGPRRQLQAGRDHERAAEPAGRRGGPAAPLRRRRLPRAAQPAGDHPDPARGRARPSGGDGLGGDRA